MPIMRSKRGHMRLVEADAASPEQLYFDGKDVLKDGDATPDEHEYVTYPTVVSTAIGENFVLADKKTRDALFLNEANGSRILTQLTSRLYDHIVKKTTDIDYGDIPKTKGDIKKLPVYEDLKDVCEIIKGLLVEFKEKSGPIDVITLAIANVENRKDLFERAYRADCELPVMIYENVVYNIIAGISYLIATSIEFVKSPKDETFQMQIDKLGYTKSKDHICYQALDKFNKACEKGDLNKAIEAVIGQRVKKFTGVVAATGVAVGIAVILGIIPLLRELVYFVYYSRTNTSEFFELQANLLQMNAYNVEANSAIDPEERKEIVRKQTAIAEQFRKISNALQIKGKAADVKASKEIQGSNKKYKVDEIDDIGAEDNYEPEVSSSLF